MQYLLLLVIIICILRNTEVRDKPSKFNFGLISRYYFAYIENLFYKMKENDKKKRAS